MAETQKCGEIHWCDVLLNGDSFAAKYIACSTISCKLDGYTVELIPGKQSEIEN